MDWSTIQGRLSTESQRKVGDFQRWMERRPSQEVVNRCLVSYMQGLNPEKLLQEERLSLGERLWRQQQREDFRAVYAQAFERPAEGVERIDTHALAIQDYAQQIAVLEDIDRRARALLQGHGPARSTELKLVSVTEAREKAAHGGWHVLLHPAAFSVLAGCRQRQKLVNGEFGGAKGMAFAGLQHLLPEVKVILYHDASEHPALRRLISELNACVCDISHVQLRLCRAYRVRMALARYNELMAEKER